MPMDMDVTLMKNGSNTELAYQWAEKFNLAIQKENSKNLGVLFIDDCH